MAENTVGRETGAKNTYEAPTLNAVGSFEALTQWAGAGYALDAPFSAGTPANGLTFSDPPR
ncbi:MAG: lasso RiPP family leader peptide-containing protein [Hyphomonadaceae bacterium]